MKKKSILLLSGGLDSAANLALCREYDDPILALTVDYGQKAARAELAAAQRLCHYYKVPHQVVDLRWLGILGGSALTEMEVSIPALSSTLLDDQESAEKTAKSVWVPNRNGVLINVAAAFAERLNAERVVVGFNVEEAATFPDNSLSYLERVNHSLVLSTLTGVQVFSYSIGWNKIKIVTEVAQLSKKFPFEMIWSCYEGGVVPCQKCESCQRLKRATSVLASFVPSVLN